MPAAKSKVRKMTEKRVKALVTGASSGLGMDFCRQLAVNCDEVLLVARRAGPMESLAEELQALGVEANILVADLADPIGTASIVEAIRQRGPLTYLVNNAINILSIIHNYIPHDILMPSFACKWYVLLCFQMAYYYVEYKGR